MSRKDIIAAVVGVLLVGAIATFAIVSALEDDDDTDLSARVAELEERVEELEERLVDGPFRFRGDNPLGDLFGEFFGEAPPEDLFRGLEDGFGRVPPEELLRGLLEGFDLDESFLDELQGSGLFEFEGDLGDALEQLRRALEEAFDQ